MDKIVPRVAYNTVVQIVGKALSVVFGVGITMMLTRYLGPEGFGQYSFVVVFVAIFASLSDWGLSLITVRDASKNSSRREEIIGSVLVVRLVLSLLVLVITNLVAHLAYRGSSTALLISIWSIFLMASSIKTSMQIVFNVFLRMENWAISELSANVISFFFTAVLVGLHLGVGEILVAQALSSLVAGGVAWGLAVRLMPIRFLFNWEVVKKIVIDSLPMGAILVIFTLYNRLDTMILSHYWGAEAVGYYSAAYKIYEVLVLGAAYFSNSILPGLSSLADHDRGLMSKLYLKSFAVLALLGLGAATFNFVGAPYFIEIIAGAKFLPAVAPLRILSLALFVSYFNHLNGYTIIAMGKQKYSLIIALIALGANLGLNLLLIPKFSYYAAAVVTFATEALIVALSLKFLARELGVITTNKTPN